MSIDRKGLGMEKSTRDRKKALGSDSWRQGGGRETSRLWRKPIGGLRTGLETTRSDLKLDRVDTKTTRTLDEGLSKVKTEIVLFKLIFSTIFKSIFQDLRVLSR